MKTEKLIWGLILVFIGGVLLLENFDVIDFYWTSVWRFWPLALILIGANMILSRTEFASSPYIALVATVLVLSFIGYQGTMAPHHSKSWFHSNVDFDDNDDEGDTTGWDGSPFSEPYSPVIKVARLNIYGGATTFNLEDTTANLVEAHVKHANTRYLLTSDITDSLQVITFKTPSKNNKFTFKDVEGNDVYFKLNKTPIWAINVKVGAGETDFDLSSFKVASLSLNGGAASFEAKLGEPVDTTRVSVKTGMAEVKLSVPESAGCQIKVKSGLSSKSFEGFIKQANGTYVTSNYDTALKKIIISLNGGLSDFEVSRY